MHAVEEASLRRSTTAAVRPAALRSTAREGEDKNGRVWTPVGDPIPGGQTRCITRPFGLSLSIFFPRVLKRSIDGRGHRLSGIRTGKSR